MRRYGGPSRTRPTRIRALSSSVKSRRIGMCGFTALALDGYGFCDILPARPTKAASYPVSVRRVDDFAPRFLQTVHCGAGFALR